MLDGDAEYFLPQIISYTNGHGLINEYYQTAYNYSPHHDGRFIWHGFLFQVLLSDVFHTSTYTQIAFAYSILNILCLILTAAIIHIHTKKNSLLISSLLLVLMLMTEGGFLIGLQGRSETLSILLILIGILVLQLKNSYQKNLLVGIIVGLLTVTSPLNAFFVALALSIYLPLQLGFSKSLVSAIVFSAIGLGLSVFLAFQIYPYQFSEWITGIGTHTKTLKTFGTISSWRHWLLFSGHFFMGAIVLLTFIISFILLNSIKLNLLLKNVFRLGIVLVFFALIYYTTISGWYVSAGLVPLFLLIILSLPSLNQLQPHPKYLFITVLAVFGISTIDPLLIGIARLGKWNGPSLEQSQRNLKSDLPQLSGIAFSAGLFVLIDNMKNNRVLLYEEYAFSKTIKSDLEYFIIQQNHSASDQPGVYENYELYIDRFAKIKKMNGRLGQWFQPAGFGYAIYRKKQ